MSGKKENFSEKRKYPRIILPVEVRLKISPLGQKDHTKTYLTLNASQNGLFVRAEKESGNLKLKEGMMIDIQIEKEADFQEIIHCNGKIARVVASAGTPDKVDCYGIEIVQMDEGNLRKWRTVLSQ